MSQFNHPNLLGLIGVVYEADMPPTVVLPYMKRGDLCHVIRSDEEVSNAASHHWCPGPK